MSDTQKLPTQEYTATPTPVQALSHANPRLKHRPDTQKTYNIKVCIDSNNHAHPPSQNLTKTQPQPEPEMGVSSLMPETWTPTAQICL